MIPAIFIVGGAISDEAENIRMKRKHGSTVVDCDIRGVKFKGEEASTHPEKYAFVIRNKLSGKIKVIERPPIYFRPAMPESSPHSSSVPQEAMHIALADNFGSSKYKKAVKESKEREELTGNVRQVEAVVSAARSRMEKKQAAAVSVTQITPPIADADASKPEDVFDLGAIMPLEIHPALEEEAKLLLDSTPEQRLAWLNEKKYKKLVIERLKYLPVDDTARMQAAMRLVLVDAMYSMYLKSATALRYRSALAALPDALGKFLYTSFTVSTETANRRVRCCPTWMKERLLCHILVLLLYNSDFQLDVPELVAHLTLSTHKLTKYFNSIGCQVESRKNEGAVAVLRTPFALPK